MNIQKSEVIDLLTYNSWWYQVNWYGMKRENARLLYKNWEQFEQHEKNKKKEITA